MGKHRRKSTEEAYALKQNKHLLLTTESIRKHYEGVCWGIRVQIPQGS